MGEGHGAVEVARTAGDRVEGGRFLAGARIARAHAHPLRIPRGLRIPHALARPHGGALGAHEPRGAREVSRGDASTLRASRRFFLRGRGRQAERMIAMRLYAGTFAARTSTCSIDGR